jgi:NADH:ubiquinone oxidoreductase subunit 4 (subunit M)
MKKFAAFWFFFWFAGAALCWVSAFVGGLMSKDHFSTGAYGLAGEMICLAVLIVSAVIAAGYNLCRYGDILGK